MATKKSEIVKISVDLKKKTLQLEAPQDFVEKNLDSILDRMGKHKSSSALSPKQEPTAEEQNKLEQDIISFAAVLANFAFGLWTISIISYLNSGLSWENYPLIGLGIVSALTSIIITRTTVQWKKSVIGFLEKHKIIKAIKDIIWLIMVAVFGLNLMQININWLKILGLLTIIIVFIEYAISYIHVFIINKPKKNP